LAVIKLGRARALVRGHFLRALECATVGQVGGDPGQIAWAKENGELSASRHLPPLAIGASAMGEADWEANEIG
jgi:hypothetical protein